MILGGTISKSTHEKLLIQCLLLEVLHQLWVQANAQLAPQRLLGGLTCHDRVRNQPLHQKSDEIID
jgi:hypothetical protein